MLSPYSCHRRQRMGYENASRPLFGSGRTQHEILDYAATARMAGPPVESLMKNALNASKALAIASLLLVTACTGGGGGEEGLHAACELRWPFGGVRGPECCWAHCQ